MEIEKKNELNAKYGKEQDRKFYLLNNVLRKRSDEMRIIIHQKWIPSFATVKRLMEELKEKPLMWHRNKEIGRAVNIISKDSIYRLWFRIYYNRSMHQFYVEVHYTQWGQDRWFSELVDDNDYVRAYDIIREQITGGWE